jgi:cob(I)alamin adenosyltransferase
MSKGYCHVYTGDGKGKTTAAFGLALRAVCAGKRVYIGQFVKDMAYSETKVTNYMDNIKIEQLGLGCFLDKPPTLEDRQAAYQALEKCGEYLKKATYDLVILDEINIAVHLKLISVEAVLQVLKARASSVEVVLTGRYADHAIIEYADLVTEMREIKHYYQQGVLSREGIDC